MKRVFIGTILLSILSTSIAYAQLKGQAKIDSLIKELPRQKEDTNKVKLLNALSGNYHLINATEGVKYGLQMLELATRLDWERGKSGANNILGLNYQHKPDFPKALAYYNAALKIDEKIDNKKGISRELQNIRLTYADQGNYVKVLEYSFKNLKLNEEMGDKAGIAISYNSVGAVYIRLHDLAKAQEYYFKALKLYEELGDKTGIASLTGNLGTTYINSDYPKALEYLFKALKLDEELGDKHAIAMVVGNIGHVYKNQKNYVMAVEYFQKSIKINEEIGDRHIVAGKLNDIAEAYLLIAEAQNAKTSSKGNGSDMIKSVEELPEKGYVPTVSIPGSKQALLAGAIDYLQRGLAIGKEINATDILEACYINLSQAYKLKADYKMAMEYGDSLKAIKDSVFSQENKQKITKLEDDRKAYGDSLKAVAEKMTADIKAEHRRNYELIGGAAFLLLLGFAFFITRNRNLLSREKKQSETLLHNILPEEVAAQLKDTGKSAAKQFDNVTVMFTDFVNFTEASERMKPEMLIEELDTCFKAFDEITTKYNIEKIKTIGDAYLAVCGLPTADPMHAENVVRATSEINAFMADRLAKLGSERTFAVRIGIHSGSVVAGIVGTRKFAYDIWGDTVNTAARMEQHGEAGKINISQTTYELVKDKFSCKYRGEVEVKGKGVMKMYFVG